MKLKNVILSTALSAFLAMPVIGASLYEGALEDRIAQLEAMMDKMDAPKSPVYGSLRIGYEYYSPDGGDSSYDVKNYGSRIGLRASREIAPGLTGLYRLEWGLGRSVGYTTDGTSTKTNDEYYVGGTRLGYVGLKGAFGEVQLGQVWGPAYNFVGAKTDIFTSSKQGYLGSFRIGDALTYVDSLGAVDYQLLAQFGQNPGEGDTINRYMIGGNIKLNSQMNLGVYYDSNDVSASDTTTEYGVAGTYEPTDDLYLAAGYYKKDPDGDNNDTEAFDIAAVLSTTGMLGSGSSLRAIYGSVDADSASTQVDNFQIGVRRQFSKYRLSAWYITAEDDNGNGGTTSNDTISLSARYDF